MSYASIHCLALPSTQKTLASLLLVLVCHDGILTVSANLLFRLFMIKNASYSSPTRISRNRSRMHVSSSVRMSLATKRKSGSLGFEGMKRAPFFFCCRSGDGWIEFGPLRRDRMKRDHGLPWNVQPTLGRSHALVFVEGQALRGTVCLFEL
jgi:hypothetical protein